MKHGMMYAIFLMFLAAMSGILFGGTIQVNCVERKNTGVGWSSLVVGSLIALSTFFMSAEVMWKTSC